MSVDSHNTVTTDTAGLEVLTRQECLRLLGRAPIGRIVFTDHALPAVQPVGFTMRGRDIVIRTSPESTLARATRDAVVAFEADDYDPRTHTGWSVTAIGLGRAVVDPNEVAALAALSLRPWASTTRAHYIRVAPDILTGRRLPAPS